MSATAGARSPDKRLDFEKLQVYQKAKILHHETRKQPFIKTEPDGPFGCEFCSENTY